MALQYHRIWGSGIEIDRIVQIIYGNIDPRTGQVADIGSFYLSAVNNLGQLYFKYGDLDTEWSLVSGVKHANDAWAGFDGSEDVIDPIFYADDIVFLLVNSAATSVAVYLPDAVAYKHRHFHVKWILNDDFCQNTVTILPSVVGQTIDGEDGQIMAEVMDSLHIVSNGINWYII